MAIFGALAPASLAHDCKSVDSGWTVVFKADATCNGRCWRPLCAALCERDCARILTITQMIEPEHVLYD